MNPLRRLIARIDVKNDFAIKGIHLEGLRKVGNPNELAKQYYEGGIDEIVFMDAVAAYYDRNSLSDIISSATNDIFVPIMVGGGIRNIKDISAALNAGADKVAINTAAVKNPLFLKQGAELFGSQCIVSSIDVKKEDVDWRVYFDNGREPSSFMLSEWLDLVQANGVGEILLTSIDKEGTKRGFDIELADFSSKRCSAPLIFCGGIGSLDNISDINHFLYEGLAVASVLHYGILDIPNIKERMKQ
jgi:cyclase